MKTRKEKLLALVMNVVFAGAVAYVSPIAFTDVLLIVLGSMLTVELSELLAIKFIK